ncbi:MAG: ShlB/FhaC/HecB family hemolysin secretion/activation protein [Gammaproteobacteria bacterium]|nr:ShlB/FhaC/HecB family hemolysin secretion/activation protein [Gammaproteobacteria bacterium]
MNRRFESHWLLLVFLLLAQISRAAIDNGEDAAVDPATPMDPEMAMQEPDEARFDIWEFEVDGANLVAQTEIERAVYGSLGPQRSYADVERAAQNIETLYRDAGYGATVFVNIPEQDISEGLVRLDVIEGKVDRLRVTGSRYFDIDRIKSKVPALAEGEVPNLPAMQEQLLALNSATGNRRIAPVMRPGRRQGTVEVELEVEDKLPVHGSVEVNNQYTSATTKTRVAGELRYENLWQREHSLGVSFQLTPEAPEEVRVLSSTYVFRPGLHDWIAAVYGVLSDSEISVLAGGGAGDIGVLGKGYVVGGRLINPLPSFDGVFHNLTVGFDYKDFDDEIALTATDESIFNPISYVKFVAGWGGFKRWDSTRLNFNVDANFSVRGLGNDEFVDVAGAPVAEFANKRAGAKSNFMYLRGSGSLEHDLTQGGRMVLKLDGQLATAPLISNEQFALGGINGSRGYSESQVLGDNALRLRLELQSPSLHGRLPGDFAREVRVLGFFDAAYGELINPLPDDLAHFRVIGTGLGLRTVLFDGLTSELLWAIALTENGDIDAGDSRIHYLLRYAF